MATHQSGVGSKDPDAAAKHNYLCQSTMSSTVGFLFAALGLMTQGSEVSCYARPKIPQIT